MNLATMIRPRPAWGAWATLCMALALPLGAGAQASAPRPGSYETEGGWGQLTIKAGNRPGTLGFSIEAIGGNAHTCSVGGTLQGDRGVADDETGPEACAIRFTARGDRIEVKPLGPGFNPSRLATSNSEAFRFVERTVREVFPDSLVAPGLMLAASDARHFDGISEASFRFMPVRFNSEDLKRPHGTDERIGVDQLADMVRFYHRLLEQAAQ